MARHHRRRLGAVLAAGLFALAPAPAGAETMMLWRGEGVEAGRTAVEQGRAEAGPALGALIEHADQALARGPYSVVDKTGFRGGDIHDYSSQGPYWWPDPESPDGLPYIRRDGQTNPEKYGDGFDSQRRHDMTRDVTALTLAGYLTGERRYLEHAARQIRTWFIAPATRMNPNMDHAQSIPGRSAGRPPGIIDSRAFVSTIDAALTLHEFGVLDDADLAALKAWFGEMAHWLETSENGLGERAAQNNHGTFYDLQLAAFHWFAGNTEAATRVAESFCAARVSTQVMSDGSQPEELARTRPYHYSLFNLQAMVNVALLARRMGLETDAAECSIEDGIRRGLEFVANWPDGPEEAAAERLFELVLVYHFLAGTDPGQNPPLPPAGAFERSVIHLLLPTDPTS